MLHGEIKVNHTVIADWFAVRRDEPSFKMNGVEDWHMYDCKVVYTDTRGYPHMAEFEVAHPYGDGALVLTSEILRKARIWMRPVHFSD